MKKVLITGASGFIGSFLVEEALKEGYDVYASIRESSDLKYLTDPKIKFIYIDFSNKESLKNQLVKLADLILLYIVQALPKLVIRNYLIL